MASEKTVFSELAVALGILGNEYPDCGGLERIDKLDGASKSKFMKRLEESKSSPPLSKSANNLYEAGLIIRRHLDSIGNSSPQIEWLGGKKTFAPAPKDLLIVGSYKVSVKENSKIIRNPSPVNVFERWPKGDFDNKRSSNWFLSVAEEELQAYYESCGGGSAIPFKSVMDYFENRSKYKEFLGEQAAKFTKNEGHPAKKKYASLCEAVSKRSSAIFNKSLNKSKLGAIARYFFLVNTSPYILSGIEDNHPFAVLIPDLDSWKERFDVLDIKANPRGAGQPEVDIFIRMTDKKANMEFQKIIRVEIRWSHGKFCGNPEAKTYRQWKPMEIPGVKPLLD